MMGLLRRIDRIFKRLFLWPGAISQDRARCQIFFDGSKTLSCTGRLGRKRTGHARRVALSCRSVQVRANGIVGFVGKQFSAIRLSGIKSSGRAGKRGGAWVGRPRWLTILMITGGSSIAAMIFKAPQQLGSVRC